MNTLHTVAQSDCIATFDMYGKLSNAAHDGFCTHCTTSNALQLASQILTHGTATVNANRFHAGAACMLPNSASDVAVSTFESNYHISTDTISGITGSSIVIT
jgi:hypothetical protein